MVQQLGSRCGDEHHRRVAQVLAEVLEQLELARLSPVDVLEDDDGRLLHAEALEEASRVEEQHLRPRRLRGRGEPEEKRDVARRFGRLFGRHHARHGELELLEPDLGRIRLEHSARCLDDAGERLVPEALFIGETAAADEPAAVGVDRRRELAAETGLPDPGWAEHGDEMRPQLGEAVAPDRTHQLDFTPAADERRANHPSLPGLGARCHGEPRRERLRLSLGRDRRERLVHHAVSGRPVGLFTDENTSDRCCALKPGCGVHDVAGCERVPLAGVERDHGLAGVDGSTSGQAETLLLVQLFDAAQHAQAGANRAFGVVSVCCGCTEHRHHGVADELLEHSAVLLDPALRLGVVELEQLANVLRVGFVRTRREVDEVDEQDRDELPLFPGIVRFFQRGAAIRAEPGDCVERYAAMRAAESLRRVARPTHPRECCASRGLTQGLG